MSHPIFSPRYTRKKFHRVRHIDRVSDDDIDLCVSWSRVDAGTELLKERVVRAAGLGPVRTGGHLSFCRQTKTASFEYTLPVSGVAMRQSWQATSMRNAQQGALNFVRFIALDAPAVSSLDSFIIDRGRDPQHTGQLTADNPCLGSATCIRQVTEHVLRLEELLQPAPQFRDQGEIGIVLRAIGQKLYLRDRLRKHLSAHPDWPSGLRLMALCIWADSLATASAGPAPQPYGRIIAATKALCLLDKDWPY